MRILADAHISVEMTEFLRSQGHDCSYANELPARMTDTEILQRAVLEQRVVLTADKDFGELVVRRGLSVPGVVLLRLTVAREAERLALVRRFWPTVEKVVLGHFVVVSNSRVRRRPLRGT
jgi:predicted nuclease of predicted toxin-antitoxin system